MEGQILNDTHPDSRKYDDELKDGIKYGQGVYTFPNGEKYEGGWKRVVVDSTCGNYENYDDWRHGTGMMTYINAVYEGEWKNNMRHGRGIFTKTKEFMYIGEWQDDKKHGYGIMKYTSGDVYKGEYK